MAFWDDSQEQLLVKKVTGEYMTDMKGLSNSPSRAKDKKKGTHLSHRGRGGFFGFSKKTGFLCVLSVTLVRQDKPG
jgi:hypothetical protein